MSLRTNTKSCVGNKKIELKSMWEESIKIKPRGEAVRASSMKFIAPLLLLRAIFMLSPTRSKYPLV